MNIYLISFLVYLISFIVVIALTFWHLHIYKKVSWLASGYGAIAILSTIVSVIPVVNTIIIFFQLKEIIYLYYCKFKNINPDEVI